MITGATTTRESQCKNREAWGAVQRLFDASPKAYSRILGRIEAVIQHSGGTLSAVDVLVKMILRSGDDPAHYTWSQVAWAASRVDSDQRRQLEGRSRYRQQGLKEYRRCLEERQRRVTEEMVEGMEGRDVVQVLRERLIPTFSTAAKAGIKDLMQQVGLVSVDTFEMPRRTVSLRTRQWRIKQAKTVAIASLATTSS